MRDGDAPTSRYESCLSASLSAPSVTSTTFTYSDAATTRRGEKLIYARQDYPGCLMAEAHVARLEGAAASMLFSSGMAAITTFFQALTPGQSVVLPRSIYWPQIVWLTEFAGRYGLSLQWVDGLEVEDFLAALTADTGLVWVEMLTNPGLRLVDVAALAAALPEEVVLAVNATCLSPALTRPITLGADFVLHSASKILGGHNDLLGGVISAAEESMLWQRIARVRWLSGNGMSARDASLLDRSLSTLSARIHAASASALIVSSHLARHPLVSALRYIGHASHPDHGKAARNLLGNGHGPLIGVELAIPPEQCQAVCEATSIWRNATAYGSAQSTLEHRATAEYMLSQSSQTYLRLSVGLEPADLLVADLSQAIELFGLKAAG